MPFDIRASWRTHRPLPKRHGRVSPHVAFQRNIPWHWNKERAYTFRGLSPRCPPEPVLLPPFALWTTFSPSPVGRVIWWLCHHLVRTRKVIPRYVGVARASSPERPDSSLERPHWSPVTLRGVDQPTVHANPKRDIGFKRSPDGCAHSPSQDSGSGNQALRIASGSYTCPVLQRFGTGSACSVCLVPFEFPRQVD